MQRSLDPLQRSSAQSMAKRAVEHSYDGAVLSPLAKRVPQAQKSGNVASDTTSTLARNSMIHIIDAMCKDKRVVMPLFALMTSPDFAKSLVAYGSEQRLWKGGDKQIDRVPRDWQADW